MKFEDFHPDIKKKKKSIKMLGERRRPNHELCAPDIVKMDGVLSPHSSGNYTLLDHAVLHGSRNFDVDELDNICHAVKTLGTLLIDVNDSRHNMKLFESFEFPLDATSSIGTADICRCITVGKDSSDVIMRNVMSRMKNLTKELNRELEQVCITKVGPVVRYLSSLSHAHLPARGVFGIGRGTSQCLSEIMALKLPDGGSCGLHSWHCAMSLSQCILPVLQRLQHAAKSM